jgi:hypothetical protein
MDKGVSPTTDVVEEDEIGFIDYLIRVEFRHELWFPFPLKPTKVVVVSLINSRR